MFNLIVEGQEAGTFPTFQEAFKEFFTKIKEMLERGTTHQMLETACQIEHQVETTLCAIDFYTARDLAYDLGILVDEGELADPMPINIDQEMVDETFARSVLSYLQTQSPKMKFAILDSLQVG